MEVKDSFEGLLTKAIVQQTTSKNLAESIMKKVVFFIFRRPCLNVGFTHKLKQYRNRRT